MDLSLPTARKSNILPYLALGSGILALSLSAMFVRWADAPGPVTGFYRLSLSTLILTPFFVQKMASSPPLNRKAILFPLLGGLFTALDFSLWNTSIAYTTAANATLLGNTAPLWVALGAWLLFRERLRRDFWLGLVLALGGAGLLMGSDFLLHPTLGVGDVMAASAGLFYGGYMLATQRSREHFDPLRHIWIVGLGATFGILVVNLLLGNPLFGYSLQTWFVFLATALVSQIIGYVMISYALGHLPASVVAPTMIGQPIVTTILAIPLLNEIPTLIQLLGGLIALAGIYLVNQAHSRRRGDVETRGREV